MSIQHRISGKSAYPPKALRLQTEVHHSNDPSRGLRVTVVSDAVAFNWRIPYARCDSYKCDIARWVQYNVV